MRGTHPPLGELPLSLTSRVLDSNGEPRADIITWISDPTLLGLPRESPEQGTVTFNLPPDDAMNAREPPQVAECIAQGSRHRLWVSRRTDANGQFELHGLGACACRITVLDSATLAAIEFGPFQANTHNLELRFDQGDLQPRVTCSLLGYPNPSRTA